MKRVILYVLAASPALLPLYLISQYSTDFPFWDQFMPGLAGLIVKSREHSLAISDLFSQHNEHRLLIPRLLYLPLALLTRWNIRAELLLEVLIVCLSSLGILRLIRITTHPDPNPPLGARIAFLWFLSNALIFSLVQFENWLWGLGVANVLPMFFVIMALVLVTSRLHLWIRAAAVMLCSLAAMYSTGGGLICWPIATGVFAFSATREEFRRKIPPLTVILAVFLIASTVYFIGYSRPSATPQIGFRPLTCLAYFAVFLGNTFALSTSFDETVVGAVIGSAMLLMVLAIGVYGVRLWLAEKDHRTAFRLLVWVSIASFPILSAAMAAVARSGLGPSQALASRYVTFSLYLPLALIHLVWIATDLMKRREPQLATGAEPRLSSRIATHAPPIFATLILMLLFQRLEGSVEDAGVYRDNQRTFRAAVLFCRALPDEPLLASVQGLPAEQLIRNAKALDDLGYLRPRLLPSNDLTPIIAQTPDPGAQGQAIRVWSPSEGMMAAGGWAMFNGRVSSEFAVLVTYEDTPGRHILVALASTGLQIADQPESVTAAAGWLASFPMARLPRNRPNCILSAWIYTARSNRATRLPGTLTVKF